MMMLLVRLVPVVLLGLVMLHLLLLLTPEAEAKGDCSDDSKGKHISTAKTAKTITAMIAEKRSAREHNTCWRMSRPRLPQNKQSIRR